MHHRLRKSPLVAFTLVILLVLLVAGLAACGSSSTSTTAAPGTGSTATTAASSTTAAPTTTAAAPSTTAASTESTAAGARALTVSAASSLKAALTEIGKAFDAANNCKTTFNFDASGTLQKQIEGGAPVDVFASAATKQVKALTDANLADAASVKVFASNKIVLIVPANSTLNITGFQDLTKADVKKIGYGDPAVAPHGVAAEQILKKLGIFDQVKPKVVYAQNVSQALTYVTSGEVEAGIVFITEALTAGDEARIVATADPSQYSAIAYPICLVSDSKVKTLGQAFIDYVTGSDGQAVLAKYGFLPPSATTTSTSTTPSS
jgi:molybdate transport system substrate-binding protein